MCDAYSINEGSTLDSKGEYASVSYETLILKQSWDTLQSLPNLIIISSAKTLIVFT